MSREGRGKGNDDCSFPNRSDSLPARSFKTSVTESDASQSDWEDFVAGKEGAGRGGDVRNEGAGRGSGGRSPPGQVSYSDLPMLENQSLHQPLVGMVIGIFLFGLFEST